MYNPYVIQANADGTMSLKQATGAGIVFKRATSSTANASMGTATVDAGILYSSLGPGSGSLTGNVTFIDLSAM